MTIAPCQGTCQNAGYMFAGVEFGDECWCDNVIRGIGAPTSSSDCNMPCSGNASETCGGSNRINIYQLTPATTSNSTISVTATSTSATPASATIPFSSTSICTMYYTVAENDYCYGIWTDFRISQEQFISWNPSLVFPQCQISVGQSVCVQQGPAGSSVLTVTGFPPSPTPTDEMPATSLLPTTVSTSGVSAVVMPTTTAPAAVPKGALSASTFSCSVFYQVTQNDSCHEIWTSFFISQDQFTSWNPPLVFPQCLIFPGDFLCVGGGARLHDYCIDLVCNLNANKQKQRFFNYYQYCDGQRVDAVVDEQRLFDRYTFHLQHRVKLNRYTSQLNLWILKEQLANVHLT